MDHITTPPRTLARAKEVIQQLRQKLGLGPLIEPAPRTAVATTITSSLPYPVESPPDLAGLTPRQRENFFADSTTDQLRKLLSIENSKSRKERSSALAGEIYRQLKQRKL